MEVVAIEAALEAIVALVPFFIGASYIVSVLILTMSKVREIFHKLRRKNTISNSDVGFLQRSINSGKVTHIQGIFNARTNQVKDYKLIKANHVEPAIQNALDRHPIVIFD